MRTHSSMATALAAIAFVLMTSLHDVCHAETVARDVYIGEEAHLPCKRTPPVGLDDVIADWGKGGSTFALSSKENKSKIYAGYIGRTEIIPSESYRLVMSDTRENDTGNYGCKFIYGTIPDYTSVDLNVYRQPILTVKTHKVTGEDKQNMATCTVLNAVSDSKLEWKETSGIDGVEGKVRKTMMNGELDYYKLTLNYKATPSFNPVEAVCIYTHHNFHLREELHNRTTYAEATLEFMTTTAPTTTTASQVAPSIDEDEFPENEIKMNVGSNKTFPCKASGNPAPTVTWQLDGNEVETAEDGENSLEIKNAQLENTGTYMCVVSSILGTENRTFTIKVIAKPEMLKPEDESSEHKLTVEMNSLDLQCNAKSNPVSSIEWIFEMEPERPVEDVTETTEGKYTKVSSVSIPHSEFSSEKVTQVVCIAKNEHGSDRRTFAVTKEARPGISSAMIVVVVVVLVVFIIAVVGAVVVHRRAVVARATAGNVESGCAQTLLCVKTPQMESDDKSEPVDDVVKEEDEEEGDEKQHLTEGTVENDAAEQPQDVAEEEKMLESPKKKLNLTGSLGCCRRSRKKLQEDEDDDDVTGNDNKNGDATANGEAATQEDAAAKNAALESISEEKKDNDVINDADSDRDSGKGDTLKPMTTAPNGEEGGANNTDNGNADVTAAATGDNK